MQQLFECGDIAVLLESYLREYSEYATLPYNIRGLTQERIDLAIEMRWNNFITCFLVNDLKNYIPQNIPEVVIDILLEKIQNALTEEQNNFLCMFYKNKSITTRQLIAISINPEFFVSVVNKINPSIYMKLLVVVTNPHILLKLLTLLNYLHDHLVPIEWDKYDIILVYWNILKNQKQIIEYILTQSENEKIRFLSFLLKMGVFAIYNWTVQKYVIRDIIFELLSKIDILSNIDRQNLHTIMKIKK